MLLAIPVTVVSKLIFGQRPFQGVPVPNFAAPAAVRLGAPLLGDSPEEGQPEEGQPEEGQPEDEDADSDPERSRVNEVRSWGIVVLIADLVNGLITTGLDAFSEQEDDAHEPTGGFGFEIVSVLLSGFSWQANFIVSDISSPSDPDKIIVK
ncbi:MAG: hypothetical protein HC822_27605, partial [Oscillochloris sp.]|nr:hypothetical protein [Oscillochloris sp.]